MFHYIQHRNKHISQEATYHVQLIFCEAVPYLRKIQNLESEIPGFKFKLCSLLKFCESQLLVLFVPESYFHCL